MTARPLPHPGLLPRGTSDPSLECALHTLTQDGWTVNDGSLVLRGLTDTQSVVVLAPSAPGRWTLSLLGPAVSARTSLSTHWVRRLADALDDIESPRTVLYGVSHHERVEIQHRRTGQTSIRLLGTNVVAADAEEISDPVISFPTCWSAGAAALLWPLTGAPTPVIPSPLTGLPAHLTADQRDWLRGQASDFLQEVAGYAATVLTMRQAQAAPDLDGTNRATPPSPRPSTPLVTQQTTCVPLHPKGDQDVPVEE